jgi:alanine racemase
LTAEVPAVFFGHRAVDWWQTWPARSIFDCKSNDWRRSAATRIGDDVGIPVRVTDQRFFQPGKIESGEPLLVCGTLDVNGSVLSNTIVQKNCFLHVRGNLLGNLTIESGATVVVEGSVDGRITNKGGRLVVNNKGLAACVTLDGPAEAEACGVLKINLTAIASNWELLRKYTEAECAAVVKANAYGCGIEPIVKALSESGCGIFFVTNLPEAKRVRAIAPNVTIYVLHGLYSGTAPAFAELNARPVINSMIEMAEWDTFVTSRQWSGGCAVNVDTAESGVGLSVEEAIAFAPKVHAQNHGITLLMSHLENDEKANHPVNERQISLFRDLRHAYSGIPGSLANSSGIFLGRKAHFDLVRPGSALYGINPTPGLSNQMLPVIELQARIVQVHNLAPRKSTAGIIGRNAKQCRRLAFVSVGYADGYPCTSPNKLQVLVGGYRCPVAGEPLMDLLPIDISDLPDPTAARRGEMVTLIGGEIGIDDVAAATRSTGREVLSHFGNRFHRIYYAI